MRCLIMTLVVLCSSAVHAAVVEWSTAEGGNGHAYEVIQAPEGITWSEARAATEANGGHLATITSQAESDFVFALVDRPLHFASGHGAGTINMWGPWLGGCCPVPLPDPAEGWQWVTDEPWDWTHWDLGRPSGAGEQFLSYGCGYTGDWSRWNDLRDTGAYVPMIAYVMEYECVPVLGDMNEDGHVNGLDVDLFVHAVIFEPFNLLADINGDGAVTGLDVEPFALAVVAGSGGSSQAVPEPAALALLLAGLGVLAGGRWRCN